MKGGTLTNILKKQYLKKQYSNSNNFMARVELNRRFKTNPYPMPLWIFDQIKFPRNAKVLEIGCGNGLLWKANINRIPEDANIILSDFSEGMLNDARKILGNAADRFEFEILDAQKIHYPDNSFDVVIANLMLYHIPNRKKAISEVSRVLNDGGALYASTFGLDDMQELKEIIINFDKDIHPSAELMARAFGLENGEKQLNNSFGYVDLVRYENSLEITEARPVVDYILSFQNNQDLEVDKIKTFENYLEGILKEEGVIKVTKDTGMFIATEPK